MALIWMFLAVGIIADVFMGSIEVITSAESIMQTKTGAVVPVKIWNATVANLTLMALGSSAPEILLSVIEIFQANFFAGSLGPGTIVGSAAFIPEEPHAGMYSMYTNNESVSPNPRDISNPAISTTCTRELSK